MRLLRSQNRIVVSSLPLISVGGAGGPAIAGGWGVAPRAGAGRGGADDSGQVARLLICFEVVRHGPQVSDLPHPRLHLGQPDHRPDPGRGQVPAVGGECQGMDRAVEITLGEDLARGRLPVLIVGPAPEQDPPVAVPADELSVRTGPDPDAGDVGRRRIPEGHRGRLHRSSNPAEVPELRLFFESPPVASRWPSLEKLSEKAGWSRAGSVIRCVSRPPAVSQTQTRGPWNLREDRPADPRRGKSVSAVSEASTAKFWYFSLSEAVRNRPLSIVQQVEFGVVLGRADDAAVEVVADCAGSACGSRESAEPSDRRNRLDDSVEIAVFEAVVEDVRRPAAGRLGLVAGLDRADDDVGRSRARICSWATRLVPSAIASIEITAATPKTMPSTVKPDRSLCSSRLFIPSLTRARCVPCYPLQCVNSSLGRPSSASCGVSISASH